MKKYPFKFSVDKTFSYFYPKRRNHFLKPINKKEQN
jgi:hypothetical protein